MQLQQLREDVRALVGDPTYGSPVESPTTFSYTQVDTAINQAINLACIQLECTYTLANISRIGPGRFMLPTDRLLVKHVLYNNKALDRSTVEFENLRNPGWRLVTIATPDRYVIEGAIVHIVGNPSGGASVGYLQEATPLVGSADEVDTRVPEFYQGVIKYAAGSILYNLDTDVQDLSIANQYMTQFQSLLSGGRPVNLVPQQG